MRRGTPHPMLAPESFRMSSWTSLATGGMRADPHRRAGGGSFGGGAPVAASAPSPPVATVAGCRWRQPILAAVEVVLIDDDTACRDIRVQQEVERLQDRGLSEVVRAQVDVVIYREERRAADAAEALDAKLSNLHALTPRSHYRRPASARRPRRSARARGTGRTRSPSASAPACGTPARTVGGCRRGCRRIAPATSRR